MIERIAWFEDANLLSAALDGAGAFLVVNDEAGRANPMTIGWAQVGICWSRPVITVLVRKSRYTFGCIRSAASFVVSVPRVGDFTDALTLCGTKSGRDVDKVEAAGLDLRPGRTVATPAIAGCVLHYEARILSRTQQQRADFVSAEVLDQYYPDGDHHLAVFGEIVEAYKIGA